VRPLGDISLRSRLPDRVRFALREWVGAFGSVTGGRRILPTFVIIGAQRSGTTSLYQYLTEHPAIAAAATKEVHFFDTRYGRGLSWYRGHFPTRASAERARRRTGFEPVAGEASPYYLFHPLAPERIARDLPFAKFIVMLRDPVSRAVSQYQHERSLGAENLDIEDAFAQEPARLGGEHERILSDPSYNSYSHQHHSYLSRGQYAEQLEHWFGVFPRERFLILETRRFFKDPETGFGDVQRFLGIPVQRRLEFTAYNTSSRTRVDDDVIARLREHFAPHNRRLYELLGEDLGWDV
jgi:sulfotransferase family protein